MEEDLRITEQEQITNLLLTLARRGYVRRSELNNILRGCKYNRFSADDLIKLISDEGENVDIIEDSGTDESANNPLEIQVKPNENGIDDLFGCLEVTEEGSDEELSGLLEIPGDPDCGADVRSNTERRERKLHISLVRARSVVDELRLRREFNIITLTREEYQLYLDKITVLSYADRKTAEALLCGLIGVFGLIAEKGIRRGKIQDRKTKSEEREKTGAGDNLLVSHGTVSGELKKDKTPVRRKNR